MRSGFKIHALDISTSVGSAIMERGKPPMFQTLRLVGDRAQMAGKLATWLDEMHMVHQFDAVAWERPLFVPKRDTVDKLEILIGLVGVAYAFAGKNSLPWCEPTIQEVKTAITGSPKADKLQMIAAAMKIGWKPADDHQADAGGVGVAAMAILNPRSVAA